MGQPVFMSGGAEHFQRVSARTQRVIAVIRGKNDLGHGNFFMIVETEAETKCSRVARLMGFTTW